MKAVTLFLLCHLTLGCALDPTGIKEIFSSHATSALTGYVVHLRVFAARDHLVIDERSPRRNFRVRVTGAEAAKLRARIDALELTPSDIDTMASQTIRMRNERGEEVVVLAPFDGVSYQFTIAGTRLVTVHNPASDPHFLSPPNGAARLRAVLDLVDDLSAQARGEIRANKAPEPTSTSVTSPANAGAAPAALVAHL